MAKRILIIEDDTFLGKVLKDKLHQRGYDVRWVEDGAEGLRQIRELRPDLILLDILLPSMNGYEILEYKQQDNDIRDIPVIVVSNSGQPVEVSRILKLGVMDYLIKAQFNPDDVFTKVVSYLGSADDGELVSLEGKRVLVVEDDVFLGELLSHKLAGEKCNYTHVTSGEEAFDLLREEKPDIILLDIVLPGLNGFEILKRLKSDPSLREIPVIMLSNLGQKHEVERSKDLGAERFLVKSSLSLNQVITEIKRLLRDYQ